MSHPFAIRCCSCQSIWEAESLSTLLQCPYCLAVLELESPATTAPVLDQQQSQELRWELGRQMLLQASERWRQRLLAEQPQLTDLPHHPQLPWWSDQRVLWRALAGVGVLTLSCLFGPWELTLALVTAACYVVVIHPGWHQDERARRLESLRTQILPMLRESPRYEFAPGGRFANAPFDAAAWLDAAWGSYPSGEVFQILGWQQKMLTADAAGTQGKESESAQARLAVYLHETKPVATDIP